MDWSDLFGGLHTGGSAILSAFGAGKLAQQLEQLESPILPEWAKSKSATSPEGVVVATPDYVILARKGKKGGDTLADIAQVLVVGGKRFDGNGYQRGEPPGKKFSFGYDSPTKVGLVTTSGKKVELTDVDKVIFLGGTEGKSTVVGWADIFRQDPNVYWGRQRAAQQPFLAAIQQRSQAGLALQQALRAEQAARAAAALAQTQSQAVPMLPSVQQSTPPLAVLQPQPPDTSNFDFSTDENLDPNYQAPPSVVGRSKFMSDDLEVLGEALLRELCGEYDGRNLEPGMATLGDYDGHNLEPGMAMLNGDLGKRGVEPGTSRLIGAIAHRMPGITILGATYLYGTDVVGAVNPPPRKNLQQAGIVIKTTPKGRAYTSLKVNRQARTSPKKTLATARAVAKRMQQVGARALASVNKLAAKTSVKGATAPTRRSVPKMAPAALKRLAEELIQSGKKLSETANKYEKTVASYKDKQKAEQKRAQQVTRVRGLDEVIDALGDDPLADESGDPYFDEIVGASQQFLYGSLEILGEDPPPVPDPTNPGYMTDGSVDPNYGGTTTDPNAAGGSRVPGPPDYGAGPAPTPESVEPQPFVDYQPGPDPSTDATFYDAPTDDALPLGAVIFDGSRVPPGGTLGNYTAFFLKMPDSDWPKGGADLSRNEGSGYRWNGSSWTLTLTSWPPGTGQKSEKPAADPNAAMVLESRANGWGPLIGAPYFYGTQTPSWTRGLRFSPSGPSGPRWFWFWDQAPDWAKQTMRMARMNDAVVAYQAAVAAGKTDFINQQIQDQLDAQDAAKMAKAQAAVDAQIAQAQEVEAQREAEAAARQAEQQAQLDAAAQQADLQFAQQQAQLDVKWQEQQMRMMEQHPELYAQMQQAQPEQSAEEGDLPTGEDGDEEQIDWGE